MTIEAHALQSRLRRLLLTQLVLLGVVATIYFALKGVAEAAAAAYGGGIACANSGLLAWRATQTAKGKVLNAHQSMRVLIRTVIERYLLVGMLFALGMGVLKLMPLPLMVGFAVGLMALFGLGKSTHG
ncbi:MAG: ATP synthase subunit I [Proteobacteria bacterium]|nr:MAG: ATP synthase subunit I [Pseudomonadota bacterium]QKK10803.1 MAG: ATP synthase subunit I [Pseudomonadota bacterium]